MAAVARRVVATDYSGEMVNVLREKLARKGLANVACSECDMYALGFETGSFDAVVCANVLHLVPDLPGALAALTNVLRPGGKLVVPTFVHAETLLAHLASRVLAITGFPGRTRLTTTSLRRFVEAAGIEVHRQQVLPGVIPVAFVAGTRRR